MSGERLELQAVEAVEVVVLMDNYADALLKPSEEVERAPTAAGGRIFPDTLVAEHGLSMLVRAVLDGAAHEVLFDAGYSPIGVPHNLDILGLSLAGVETVVLSHGHMDHTGALESISERIPGTTPLVLHPDVLVSSRYLETPDGLRMDFPTPPNIEGLGNLGFQVNENRLPLSIADGTILVTGEVPRGTSYEKGISGAFLERDGKREKDSILDDQALVLVLKDKGLVVVAGCSHAGIVNTVRYAVDLTGEGRVHAILGGFHLADDEDGSLTENTIQDLKAFSPHLIMPMHCTGWDAVHKIAEAFPSAFALSSVGAKVVLR